MKGSQPRRGRKSANGRKEDDYRRDERLQKREIERNDRERN